MPHAKLNGAMHTIAGARMIRIALFALFFAVPLLAPKNVRADNCSIDSCATYSVTGTFQDGGNLTGSFVIDETNGTIASSNFVADGTSFSSGLYYLYQFPVSVGPDVFNDFSSGGSELSIQFGPFGLTTLPTSFDLSSTTHIALPTGAWIYLDSASVVETPEPGSLLLLIMGCLTIVIYNFRRGFPLRSD
jgi:hypothetical protein